MSIGDWFAVACLVVVGLAVLAYVGLLIVGWLVKRSGGWR